MQHDHWLASCYYSTKTNQYMVTCGKYHPCNKTVILQSFIFEWINRYTNKNISKYHFWTLHDTVLFTAAWYLLLGLTFHNECWTLWISVDTPTLLTLWSIDIPGKLSSHEGEEKKLLIFFKKKQSDPDAHNNTLCSLIELTAEQSPWDWLQTWLYSM